MHSPDNLPVLCIMLVNADTSNTRRDTIKSTEDVVFNINTLIYHQCVVFTIEPYTHTIIQSNFLQYLRHECQVWAILYSWKCSISSTKWSEWRWRRLLPHAGNIIISSSVVGWARMIYLPKTWLCVVFLVLSLETIKQAALKCQWPFLFQYFRPDTVNNERSNW